MKTNPASFRLIPSLLILSLCTALTGFAADAEKKLPEGKPIIKQGDGGQNLNTGPAMEGEIKKVKVDGQPFKEAFHITVKKQPADIWHVQISNPLSVPAKKGDVVLVSFYTRKIEGGGRFNVYLGTPETDLEVTMSEELTATREWKKVQMPATIAANYEAGKGMLNFDLGSGEQALEIADIRLVSFGDKTPESSLPRSSP